MIANKSIFIKCKLYKVFDFIENVENWPRYAIHNVKSAIKAEDGTWHIQTPRGPGKIMMRSSREIGSLEHEFIDAEGNSWLVPARVEEVEGGGTIFAVRFKKPEGMPEADFHQGTASIDEELKILKKILEGEQ